MSQALRMAASLVGIIAQEIAAFRHPGAKGLWSRSLYEGNAA
jgi:hypothetical protein